MFFGIFTVGSFSARDNSVRIGIRRPIRKEIDGDSRSFSHYENRVSENNQTKTRKNGEITWNEQFLDLNVFNLMHLTYVYMYYEKNR